MKIPQDILTFVKRLKDPKLFGEISDKDAVEGRVLPICTHVCIKCWKLLYLVVLRMNQEFMKFRRQYYAHCLNEPFGKFGTVLTVESNVEMGVVDLDSDSHSA